MTSSFAHIPYGSIPFSQHRGTFPTSFSGINNGVFSQGKIISMITAMFPSVQQDTLNEILPGNGIAIDRDVAGQITISTLGGIPDGTITGDVPFWYDTNWVLPSTVGINTNLILGNNETDKMDIIITREKNVVIGFDIGENTILSLIDRDNGIAIGNRAASVLLNNNIMIGEEAGGDIAVDPNTYTTTNKKSIAIGHQSGMKWTSGISNIAIGDGAGGTISTLIDAINPGQTQRCTAIGFQAGTNQAREAVAIGTSSGNDGAGGIQGEASVSIGKDSHIIFPAPEAAGDHHIILNASGVGITKADIKDYGATPNDRCFILPIREVVNPGANGYFQLFYDKDSGEVVVAA